MNIFMAVTDIRMLPSVILVPKSHDSKEHWASYEYNHLVN